MIKTLLLLLVIFVATLVGCHSQSFKAISKQIEKREQMKKPKKGETTFHEVRLKLYQEGKLNFISESNDTIYLLESQEIETGKLVGKIWNNKGSISYAYQNAAFDFTYQPFTEYTCQLIQNWDTLAIRQEEKANSGVSHSKLIYGYRVIIDRGKWYVNNITFHEFINFRRDFVPNRE
jgi:hypothetical protein